MSSLTYIVVFGLDGEGRPRAACFPEHDATLAMKAARYLGYRSVQIGDPGLAEVLPRGNIFASRNAFVRRISRTIFEQLLAAASQTSRHAADAGFLPTTQKTVRGKL
jgi:hypothetical protein